MMSNYLPPDGDPDEKKSPPHGESGSAPGLAALKLVSPMPFVTSFGKYGAMGQYLNFMMSLSKDGSPEARALQRRGLKTTLLCTSVYRDPNELSGFLTAVQAVMLEGCKDLGRDHVRLDALMMVVGQMLICDGKFEAESSSDPRGTFSTQVMSIFAAIGWMKIHDIDKATVSFAPWADDEETVKTREALQALRGKMRNFIEEIPECGPAQITGMKLCLRYVFQPYQNFPSFETVFSSPSPSRLPPLG